MVLKLNQKTLFCSDGSCTRKHASIKTVCADFKQWLSIFDMKPIGYYFNVSRDNYRDNYNNLCAIVKVPISSKWVFTDSDRTLFKVVV